MAVNANSEFSCTTTFVYKLFVFHSSRLLGQYLREISSWYRYCVPPTCIVIKNHFFGFCLCFCFCFFLFWCRRINTGDLGSQIRLRILQKRTKRCANLCSRVKDTKVRTWNKHTYTIVPVCLELRKPKCRPDLDMDSNSMIPLSWVQLGLFLKD